MKPLKEYSIAAIIVIVVYGSIIMLTLFSCTPQKRLSRLIDRHPYLAQKDTVKTTDTFSITVPGVKADSSFLLDDARRDTIVIRNEQMTIKTFIHKDTLYVSGECDTVRETIIREIEIPYDKFMYRKPRDVLAWYHWLAISLGIIGLIILFILIGRR